MIFILIARSHHVDLCTQLAHSPPFQFTQEYKLE